MNGEEIICKEGICGIYLNYNLTYFSLERHIWKEKEKSGEKKSLIATDISNLLRVEYRRKFKFEMSFAYYLSSSNTS